MKTFIDFLVENVHSKRLGNLSKEEKSSIWNYTYGSRHINSYLHKNYHKEQVKSQKSTVHHLDKVFANKANHVGKNHVVYTGLHESPQNVIDKEQKRIGKKPEHVHVHLPAYTSTSTDKEVAKKFPGEEDDHDHTIETIHKEHHILKIHVPAHHPSVSVRHLSKHPEENEVLLHRGTRLKIHAKPTITTKTEKKYEYDYSDWKYKPVTTEHKFHEWHAEVVGHHLDDLK